MLEESFKVIQKPPFYHLFLEACEMHIRRAAEKDFPLSIGILDLDLFGLLNKEVGEEVCDNVLAKVEEFLRSKCLSGEQLFRYGGDAFALLMPDVEKEQGFFRVETLRHAFNLLQEESSPFGLHAKRLTFSGGVATYPDDGVTCLGIVRKANEAMYRAKNNGRNRVCLAREEKMMTKTTHYTQGQLQGLHRLAERMGVNEAELLREALDDLLRKYNA